MRRNSISLNLAGCVLAAFTLAGTASGQVGGPELGWVQDAGGIRRISGIAAAAAVGNVQSPGQALGLVGISPSQTYSLATAADTGQVLLLLPSNDGLSFVASPVSGATAAPARIVFSPNGSTAMLWFAATGHLQVISGLPQSAAVREVDTSFLTSGLVDLPATLAVSDDAQWAAGSWKQGINAFGPAGQVIPVPAVGQADALSFAHGSTNLAIHTPEEMVIITDVPGKAAQNVIWTKAPDTAPDAPVQVAEGLGFSSDNTFVVVSGSLGGVSGINLASNNDGKYATCGCSPTGLTYMGGTVFRLTEVVSNAVRFYDASSNDVFVAPLAAVRRTPRPIRRLTDAGGDRVQ